MRLTLRTLLAYLDDILEPAQAKEIGEKIAESPVASELAGRIREILRRRRITAPQISGPGSGPDPNLTAEYLDNTLSPEAVTEFEQICLESDVHLAEVAACHQILTLVLGEPADVSNELRERMYALGAVAPAETATENLPNRLWQRLAGRVWKISQIQHRQVRPLTVNRDHLRMVYRHSYAGGHWPAGPFQRQLC